MGRVLGGGGKWVEVVRIVMGLGRKKSRELGGFCKKYSSRLMVQAASVCGEAGSSCVLRM